MTIIRIISCIIPIISNVCPGFSSLQSQPMHCRPTYIDPMRCIMPSHQPQSSPSCHMGSIHAVFFGIIRIKSLLYPIILFNALIRNSIWVRHDEGMRGKTSEGSEGGGAEPRPPPPSSRSWDSGCPTPPPHKSRAPRRG